ncbi:MAG: glycoside hydrolase family 127 protein, partial [Candidatus Poribacteria bacterium]
NLYISSETNVKIGNVDVQFSQETDYPWSGSVKVVVKPSKNAVFNVNMRMPDWCKSAKVNVNGQSVDSKPNDNGYIAISREWQKGDHIIIDMEMPIQRICANPKVNADIGRVALQRGPVVYCLEAEDNEGSVLDIALPRNAELSASFKSDLLNGVVIIQGKGLRKGKMDWENKLYQPVPDDIETKITAIPYYAWDNRLAGEMVIWLPEVTSLAEDKGSND